MNIQNILIPLDLSDNDSKQLQATRLMASCSDLVRVELLHVQPMYAESDIIAKTRNELEKAQIDLIKLLDNPDIEVNQSVRFGEPAAEILQVMDETDTDLVVLNSHGHGAAYHAFIGSTAQRLLRDISTPALILPKQLNRIPSELSQISVGVDFGQGTKKLVLEAEMLAKRCEASLHFIHLRNPPDALTGAGLTADFTPQLIHEAILEGMKSNIIKISETLDPELVHHATFQAEFGNPAKDLVLECAKSGSDLILIASHGHGRTFDLLIGSVAQGIIQRSSLPVLLMPSDKEME